MSVSLIQITPVAKAQREQPVQAPPPWMHILEGDPPLLFLVNGSQLFQITPPMEGRLIRGDRELESQLRRLARVPSQNQGTETTLSPYRAVSLNLAQHCNLSCKYCYADEGRFGGTPKLMTEGVALQVIDQLFSFPRSGGNVVIGFMGGEPFLNRPALYRTVERARALSVSKGIPVSFSVTTNATLLQSRDLDLLRDNGFSVTVSLDGTTDSKDGLRTSKDGSDSQEQAISRIRPLLDRPGRTRISARITISRLDLRVTEKIEFLANLGFRDIGVSPLRTSPDPSLILNTEDWARFLKEMTRAGEIEWQRIKGGHDFRFANMEIALKEIHRGSSRSLPCGAAKDYVSVDAEGNYFTCHRTIGDPRFVLGDLESGPRPESRSAFLKFRHVDSQAPCSSCWARYLCGGGCHAEVIQAGRQGCDYIRGWLEYCLRIYNQISLEKPRLLEQVTELTHG
jgi:uncharacterized protein